MEFRSGRVKGNIDGCICFKEISYCPKPMAVTPYLHPKITNGIVSVDGPLFGFGFRARPVTATSSLSAMATAPSTLSNALLPSRTNLIFLKGAGFTRRRPPGFSARPTHLRICGSPLRVAVAAASSAEEQPTSTGVRVCVINVEEIGIWCRWTVFDFIDS